MLCALGIAILFVIVLIVYRKRGHNKVVVADENQMEAAFGWGGSSAIVRECSV